MAVQLGEQVTRYRAEAVEKQFEIEEDLTREIREHMEEVQGELQLLAQKLADTMKSLAGFEATKMELDVAERQKKKFSKERQRNLGNFLVASDNSKVDIAGMVEDEEAARFQQRRSILHNSKQLAVEIQAAYETKEAIEMEMVGKRHEIVIDQELLRARAFLTEGRQADDD